MALPVALCIPPGGGAEAGEGGGNDALLDSLKRCSIGDLGQEVFLFAEDRIIFQYNFWEEITLMDRVL